MKSKKTVFLFIFSILFFSSFASENKSEILPKKDISETKIIPQTKEFSIQSEKQKLNFKEKIALKLIEKKIKKQNLKNIQKNSSSVKMSDTVFVLVEIGLLSLVLTSIILSIVSFFSGNILVGILLLLTAALFALIFLMFAMVDRTERPNPVE